MMWVLSRVLEELESGLVEFLVLRLEIVEFEFLEERFRLSVILMSLLVDVMLVVGLDEEEEEKFFKVFFKFVVVVCVFIFDKLLSLFGMDNMFFVMKELILFL